MEGENMTTELDRFLTDLKTDTNLQAAVTNDTDTIDSLVNLANARGYSFTLSDYNAMEQRLETGDMLTDEQPALYRRNSGLVARVDPGTPRGSGPRSPHRTLLLGHQPAR
jgi:hypothetical protein